MQSFIGLAGLIFEINGETDNLKPFLQSKPHIGAMRHARMIFLRSRLCFVENTAHYMNLRPGAYGLNL